MIQLDQLPTELREQVRQDVLRIAQRYADAAT